MDKTPTAFLKKQRPVTSGLIKSFVTAEAFVDALLTKEAAEQPSDEVNPDALVMELPEWFDEKKFNR